MSDGPIHAPIELTLPEAERILARWLGHEVPCTGIRPLTGGCINSVYELAFDHQASPVVAKLSAIPGDRELQRQAHVMDYFRRHTSFPGPELLCCDTTCECVPYSFVVIQRLPGTHLGQAELSPRQRGALQVEMAHHLADLHRHAGGAFGDLIAGDGRETWAEWKQQEMLEVYRENERVGRLSQDTMRRIAEIIGDLPTLLEAPLQPVLNHTDLWSANVIVHNGRLSGFVDPGGLFAPNELDLAYLELWHTANDDFFNAYRDVHPRVDGYERRRDVYWLHTLMIHVWLFGTAEYVRATEELVERRW